MAIKILNTHMLTVKKTINSCYIKKNIPLQGYENSAMKNEYHYLYKKDEELKDDNITVENQGVLEYGNDFINCKTIHSKQ